MSEQKDLVKTLRQLEFFRNFSGEETEKLLHISQWVKAGAGQCLITESADDRYLYVLVRGQANVVKQGKLLAVLSPGEIFGEISALAGSPRSAHVIAKTECYCVRFEPLLLDRLPQEIELKLVKNILYTLAHRLTALNRRYTAV
ncbi:MAG: cyclic nucleotide-binding domain-containing protein [Thermodesulfobacteriota bacterium]